MNYSSEHRVCGGMWSYLQTKEYIEIKLKNICSKKQESARAFPFCLDWDSEKRVIERLIAYVVCVLFTETSKTEVLQMPSAKKQNLCQGV